MIITDLLIDKLNNEIRYWQERALAASSENDKEGCQLALKSQSEAIDTLIKLIVANKNNRLCL